MSNELPDDKALPETPLTPERCPRSYRLGRRGEAADRNRMRILDAARTLLRTEGLPGLTMEAVARQAGVTRQTVHNQFGSRAGLLEAVCDSVALSAGLDRIPELFREPDALRALERLIEIFVGFWSSDPGLIPRLTGIAAVDPDLAGQLEDRTERRRFLLARLVERLREQGQIPAAVPEADLVDTLFLLTSFASYSELAARGRSPAAVTRLLFHLARAALRLPSGLP